MAANHGNGANAGGPPASSSLLGSTGAHARSESSVADTLPPQPLKELLSAGGANLYVLSRDPELIDTVQRAGGEQFPVFAVAAWAELELAVESGRCGIALLDADLVGGSLAGHIVALQDYAHRVVTLVAADRAVAQGLMGYLSDRRIHRLLIKPPAHGITRLLIESAVNRCLQLRELAAQSEPSEPLRPRPAPRVATRMPIWIPVAAGMTLLAGVGIVGTLSSWWGERSPSGGQPTAQSVTPTAPASASDAADRGSQRFTDLLGRAEQAFREGRLEAPQGDNALDYYLAILAADPTVEPARDGLGDVVDALFAQAEAAMLANELERAAATLDSIRRAEPASSRLVFLDA